MIPEKIHSIITQYESAGVAFSAGIDSALVLKLCREILGRSKVRAFTAVSPSFPASEKKQAIGLAAEIDVDICFIHPNEHVRPEYQVNNRERCFFCKESLYGEMYKEAQGLGLKYLVNGSNADDLHDHRPGMKAAHLYQVRSPLLEAGMRKDEVRSLAKQLGISVWKKPASPCLASRIPYGSEVTPHKLQQIEKAEAFIKDLGYEIVRVRHYGLEARVELDEQELVRAEKERLAETVKEYLNHLGFEEITIDPTGFRSGRLNEAIRLLPAKNELN